LQLLRVARAEPRRSQRLRTMIQEIHANDDTTGNSNVTDASFASSSFLLSSSTPGPTPIVLPLPQSSLPLSLSAATTFSTTRTTHTTGQTSTRIFRRTYTQNTNSNSTEPAFDDAINLVAKVKKRFAAQPEKYRAFLRVLHMYQSKDRGLGQVCDEVSSLFRELFDLLEGFIYFLPDAMQAHARDHMRKIIPQLSPQNGGREIHKLTNLIRRRMANSAAAAAAVAADGIPCNKKDFGQCIICSDAQRSTAFVPCGHLVVCHSCASRCMEKSGCCPICNQKAGSVQK